MAASEELSRKANDALSHLLGQAADSSSISAQDKYEILEILNDIQKMAGAVFDMVEQNKAFHPATINAIHQIESECGTLRLRLAGEILKRNPDALHAAMNLHKRRQERNAQGT